MFARSHRAAPVILLSAVLVSACRDQADGTHLRDLRVFAPLQAGPPPAVDVWSVTARLTMVTGGECVGDMMQSQIGAPKSYSLTMTAIDSTVAVTLTSASGDYVCTFTGVPLETDGTFGPARGRFSCKAGGNVQGFRCANGQERDIWMQDADVSGRISENEISGTWSEARLVAMQAYSPFPCDPFTPTDCTGEVRPLEFSTEFTGIR